MILSNILEMGLIDAEQDTSPLAYGDTRTRGSIIFSKAKSKFKCFAQTIISCWIETSTMMVK